MQKLPLKLRERPKSGWFYADNETIDILSKYLGPHALCVYMSLCRHADNYQRCFPGQKLMAKELGMGERTVRKAVKLLKEMHVIHCRKEKINKSANLHNVYYIADKTEWLVSKAYHASAKGQKDTEIEAGEYKSDRHIVTVKDTHSNNTQDNKTKVEGELLLAPLNEKQQTEMQEKYSKELGVLRGTPGYQFDAEKDLKTLIALCARRPEVKIKDVVFKFSMAKHCYKPIMPWNNGRQELINWFMRANYHELEGYKEDKEEGDDDLDGED